jgi:2,3-dihydroxybenzoate decarboxylase
MVSSSFPEICSFYRQFPAELARAAPVGLPMLRNLSSYWKTNLLETVSGNFATDLFNLHAKQIGLNRILYSVNVSVPRCVVF